MAIRTSARWVTPQDFKNYFGEDLDAILKKDNESNGTNLFLMHVEDRLVDWIFTRSGRLTPWESLTPFQQEQFQIAILIQANYILRNGNITFDSGYDPEVGIKVSQENIEKIEICRACVEKLIVSGLYNHEYPNRRRYMRL